MSEHKKTDQHLQSMESQKEIEIKIEIEIERDTERYREKEREREGERENFDIAYFLAKKRRPYSDFSELIILQKMHEVNLASVITTIKFAPNSLISSINQYLRSSLKVRFYCSYVMEVPILLLLRKKAFMSCVRGSGYVPFNIFISLSERCSTSRC